MRGCERSHSYGVACVVVLVLVSFWVSALRGLRSPDAWRTGNYGFSEAFSAPVSRAVLGFNFRMKRRTARGLYWLQRQEMVLFSSGRSGVHSDERFS